MNEITPIICRPLFRAEEVESILNSAVRFAQNRVQYGQEYFSAQDILDYAATSVRETFFEIGNDHLEEVTVNAIG